MLLGDVLVAHGFVTKEEIEAAIARQARQGGRLGENLVALGMLSEEQLRDALDAVPSSPRSLEEVGLEIPALLDLATKAMQAGTIETPSKLAELLRLPSRLGLDLMRAAEQRQLVESQGMASTHAMGELRYSLTTKGRQWAQNALELSSYVGPAPVSLEDYVARIRRQRIAGERVPPERVRAALGDLTMSAHLVAQIGPSVNSGHSILLYGPPGNGKTSVAERIGQIFSSIIYVPYCFTVADQIIRVFDPSLHRVAVTEDSDASGKAPTILRETIDQRWVACHRPCVMTGGELTLEMLDLNFNPMARFYEAPLHVKALNGVFLIDDFGRQIVSPEALLNRWIVPLSARIDYLKLHTGKSFSLPFDELVIFSTNMAPSELMDPAFLRRIPYKIEIGAPDMAEYAAIFRAVAQTREMVVTDDMIAYVITALTVRNSFPLAAYQPWFLLDQVLASCKYEGSAPVVTREKLDFAIANLYTKDSPGFGLMRAVPAHEARSMQAVA